MSIDMKIYIGGTLTDSKATKARHLKQAEIINDKIGNRWKLTHPEQWKCKHVRWLLDEQTKTLSPETQYRYWLTIQIIVKRRNKSKDWLPRLNGPWTQRARKN